MLLKTGVTRIIEQGALADEDPLQGAELEEGDAGPDNRSRRDEAKSLYHQLRHLPNNPHCESCNRARFRLSKKFAGAFDRDA
ncbi:MAG: hypothetical protein ACKPKO_54995, partial [Candidatus Fonsibacter sp.]